MVDERVYPNFVSFISSDFPATTLQHEQATCPGNDTVRCRIPPRCSLLIPVTGRYCLGGLSTPDYSTDGEVSRVSRADTADKLLADIIVCGTDEDENEMDLRCNERKAELWSWTD